MRIGKEAVIIDFEEMLAGAYSRGASDLILTVGQPPQIKLHGALVSLYESKLRADELAGIVEELLNDSQQAELARAQRVDFSSGYAGLSRFRFHVFRQRGTPALVARVIPHDIPGLDSLGLPVEVLKRFAKQPSGLVLFTGPTGSGKSTSMASVIQYINQTRSTHVICLEDPIEFLHNHKYSTIEQREIGTDTPSFSEALRDVFREAPDVVMVGEMRDWETMAQTLKLAETGHLVFGTLHTHDAVQTVSRIVHSFPIESQQQVYVQLSSVLSGVVAQQLLPRADKQGRIMCFELLVVTDAVRNLIREGQQHQIYSVLQTGRESGMCTMNEMLLRHTQAGLIDQNVAVAYSMRPDELRKMLTSVSLRESV